MSKKKPAPDADAISANTSALFTAMAAASSEVDVRNGTLYSSDVGLPLPALAPRYLLQTTCFPLSRITQITGEEGSAKSSFLYEIMRWFLTYDGGVIFAENENKDATELRSSILNWRADWMSRIQMTDTNSLEEWQKFLTERAQLARSIMSKKGGVGFTIPLLFCVDSLTSTAPESMIETFEKSGCSSLSHPIQANLLSSYMKCMVKQLADYPFCFIATNHLKPGQTPQGIPKSNVPGGKSTKFMESFELELARVSDLNRKDVSGIRVKMTTRKNSKGGGRKSILVNLQWTVTTDAEGRFRQISRWDWHTASIELLLSFDDTAYMRERIREVCGIRLDSQTRKTCYSELMGVPKESPVTFEQMSIMLEQRLDILDELYKILWITPAAMFEPGVDYRLQKANAAKSVALQSATRYANIESLPALSMAATDEP